MTQHTNTRPYQSNQLGERPSLLDSGRCLTFLLENAHVILREFLGKKLSLVSPKIQCLNSNCNNKL